MNNQNCLIPLIVKTTQQQDWEYESDEKSGICVIAKDKMRMRITLRKTGHDFPDVLEVERVINEKLKDPVSVESMCDYLCDAFPEFSVQVRGRADSHGWIEAIGCK